MTETLGTIRLTGRFGAPCWISSDAYNHPSTCGGSRVQAAEVSVPE
jgi:hypothetical protein